MYEKKTNPKSAPAEMNPAEATAKAAGLRYVNDNRPGIGRRRCGKGFIYLDPCGLPIQDKQVIGRIQALAIPPAWTEVWICPSPNGHIQATARDAKGRKQYRYHERWREVRDETKFEHLLAFGEALPKLRKQIEADFKLPGLPRRKILATLVRLLEETFIRIGNQEYARTNKSFGLTTLRDRHVKVNGAKLSFRFRGKSGKHQNISLTDRRLAKIVKQCQDLPGQELFVYLDEEGQIQEIDSADVNQYLREITGQEITAKDFRTWAGTVLAAHSLRERETFASESEARKNILQAIESVSEKLGNTPAVCRKCYVHPVIFDAYLDHSLAVSSGKGSKKAPRRYRRGLRSEECFVMNLLQKKTKRVSH